MPACRQNACAAPFTHHLAAPPTRIAGHFRTLLFALRGGNAPLPHTAHAWCLDSRGQDILPPPAACHAYTTLEQTDAVSPMAPNVGRALDSCREQTFNTARTPLTVPRCAGGQNWNTCLLLQHTPSPTYFEQLASPARWLWRWRDNNYAFEYSSCGAGQTTRWPPRWRPIPPHSASRYLTGHAVRGYTTFTYLPHHLAYSAPSSQHGGARAARKRRRGEKKGNAAWRKKKTDGRWAKMSGQWTTTARAELSLPALPTTSHPSPRRYAPHTTTPPAGALSTTPCATSPTAQLLCSHHTGCLLCLPHICALTSPLCLCPASPLPYLLPL